MLQKTLQSPLNSKESQQVNHKGNQPWIFIGKIDAEAEAPIIWPPDAMQRADSLEKTDAGKDWGPEDEMVDWYHQPNEHEFE